MIVVDASALLEVLLRTPAAEAIEALLFAERQTLHAPYLLDVEVTQVLRRYAREGAIDEGRGSEAIADLADFAIRRYPHGFLLRRVWSMRNNFTAYDAIYVALAEALNARFLTRDQRLAAAIRHHADIELI